MAENAGGIYYDIEMDVQGLLVAQQRVNQRLDMMERGFDGTTRAVNNTERSMSSLSGVAVALAAALSVKQVSEYADAWATVNNKLSNSVRPTEQLADVTQRVFDVTQATRSSLDATATLYARLERGTRQYNTSAADLAKLTTIINQGFVVSGATAQEAENAIIQLSQGIASGVLRGEEFNSVAEQGSRLMVALADSLGVGIGELRAMAAQGKLTTDVVVNGLLSQGAVIGKEFANTTTTISQAMQVASNNITKFFGENSTVKTGAAIFNDAVVSASENIGILSAAITAAAAVIGSRYLSALTMSAAAQVQSAIASQRQAAANNQAAQTALVAATSVQRKSVADKEAALSALALAQAEYNVAKGSAAEMLAMDALVAAKTRASVASLALVQAENAQAVASNRAAAASRAASVGIGLARGALSLIGGPVGAAMLAATAIFYFWQKAQQAREEAIRFADSLDKVNASMKAMNNTQLSGTIADANKSIRAQKDEISNLQAEVDSLRSRYQNFTPEAQAVANAMGQGADFARQQAEVSDQLAQKSRDLANAQEKLARTQDTAAEANRTLTNNMLTSMGVHDGLIQKGWSLEQVQGAVAKAFGNTADEINRANQAGQNFNPKALQVSPPTADGDKVILNLEEQNALLKIQDERQRAVTKARMQAAKVTDNPNQISKAGNLAGENYDLQKAEEARQEAQRKGEQQDKRSATAAESVAQKLDKLRSAQDLSTESVEKRRIQEAGLRAEQSLGSAATQKQLDEARALGEANERAALSIQKRAEAEQATKAATQLKAQADTSIDPITGQATNPLAEVELEESQKLAIYKKYYDLGLIDINTFETTKTAIHQLAANERNRISQEETDRQQQNMSQLLGASSDFFGQMAGLVGDYAGESSAAYKTLFAVSKAFSIAQATMNMVMAISNAAALPWPANIPAIAVAAAQGANLISQIRGSNYSGARYNGGPVSAGGVYKVGEKGKPEIYRASNGSQYMIPGDNGSVISNKDLRGSGGGTLQVVNNVYNYASGVSVDTRSSQNGGQMVTDIIITDIQSGGPISSEMQGAFGLRRQALGDY